MGSEAIPVAVHLPQGWGGVGRGTRMGAQGGGGLGVGPEP